ncbi:MAG TPA: TIM barrel protein [Candidatus Galloscillospira excrementipullorum]|nr:TIM barrel protein [Candidatus Galloscillospira excrementipullorum]
MTAKFGPAGNSDAFYEAGNKATLQIPGYLESLGLTAYEYQCGRGVTVGEETARKLGAKAAEHGITLSLHAPYYISLSSVEPEKREASIGYLLASARALDWMGGSRVILHSGSCGKMSREQALSLACETLARARAALDEAGYAHIVLCPETMGKINQLGTLEEVLTLCELDERMLPCIDFGHLNARTLGAVRTQEDYAAILDAVEQRLGKERARSFHSHFSKIEYTAGGEKRHLTFATDTGFGPDFEPLARLVVQRGLSPTIICESAGTQDLDALAMQQTLKQIEEEMAS